MKTLTLNSYVKALHKPMACFMIMCLLSGQFLWATDTTDITGVGIVGSGSVNQTGNTAGGVDTNFVLNGKSIYNLTSGGTRNIDAWNVSGGSAMLARVQQAVEFNGALNASGVQVYIVSANGIQIGSSAVINAADFVASGLNVTNTDFLDGGLDTFAPFDMGNGMTMIGTVQNDGTIHVTGNAALLGSEVLNNGTIVSDGGLIVLATGDEIVLGSDRSDIVVNITLPNDGPTYQVINSETGVINNEGGDIVLAAGDDFAQALAMNNAGIVPQSGKYSVEQKGTINDSDTGNSAVVEMSAANQVITRAGSSIKADDINIAALDVQLQENMIASSELFINSDIGITTKGLESTDAMSLEAETGSIYVDGTVDTDSTLSMKAETSVILRDTVSSVDQMDLTAGTIIIADKDVSSMDTLSAKATAMTYAGGDITAEKDLTIDTGELRLYREGDQTVASAQGTTTVTGNVIKTKAGELNISGGAAGLAVDLKGNVDGNGNIYIAGKGDVQLSGDINAIGKASRGGVSVISTDGKIYTEGTDDGLNVQITGYSDSRTGEGVDLPFGEGKAAIVLQSKETLEIGSGASLYAAGWYMSSDEGVSGVDDRDGADLLSTDETIIGGFERNEGDPIDIAIYLASTGKDVIIHTNEGEGSESFNIYVSNYDRGIAKADLLPEQDAYEMPGTATVVIDAKEFVEFPEFEAFIASLSEVELTQFMEQLMSYSQEMGGYRMEVVSRVTQWLFEAIDNGTLPFADNTDIMKALLGDEYVLRGAGAEDNTRAWVLEDPTDVPGVAPLASLQLPELKGCPVEMDAAAAELAMNSDDLQLLIGNSLAANPNIQPCKACQKLVTAASILNDQNGARMAAMNQIFNTLAPIDAPFTPEVQASVATAFANLSNDDQQYALASEYVNAFVDYVAVLSEDLQAPVGDPVAYVLEKHGEAITGSENPNMAAFVMAQIQSSGESI